MLRQGAMCATLVATCDFHSSVPEGQATLTALGGWRAAGALIVDAGDFFGGNAFYEFSQGQSEERILAEFYDAVVPGNHDLADLMRLREPTLFPPVVCCNLAPPVSFAGRWTTGLLLPAGGLRVGVVGFIGAQAFAAVQHDERAGFTFTEATAELLAAERDRLLALGADVVVGVSHSGFAHDVALQRSGASPFEMIVAGHCHGEHYLWAKDGRHVGKAPELGAGLLRVDLRPGGVHTIAVEYHRPGPAQGQDAAVLAAYQAWGAEVLGTLTAAVPDRDALARLVAEKARTDCGVDAFVLNLPALRAGLPAVVTRRALVDAAPFDGELVRLAGTHDIGEVVQRARDLGEEPVLAGAPTGGGTGTVATTAYLAGRLGLPADPVQPHTTLRSTIHSLLGSRT